VSDPHAEPELGRLQRRLWRLITEPEGIAAALAAEKDLPREGLSGLLRGDLGLAPEERLAVYSSAYFNRIHECLRGDFGALARALGPAAFQDLVKTYLMAHPPSHPSLRYAGKDLAGFLETQPFAGIFSRRCAYCADLARLEWALCDAFDAKDAPVLAREELAAIEPEAWAGLRFKTSPSLAVLSLRWPVQAVRERFDRESEDATWDAPPALEPAETHLRVWRREEVVYSSAISRLEAEVLRGLERGEKFVALCERVAEEVGDARAAAQAAAFLEAWVSAGLLCDLA
jgi:hypothetical protein